MPGTVLAENEIPRARDFTQEEKELLAERRQTVIELMLEGRELFMEKEKTDLSRRAKKQLLFARLQELFRRSGRQ